MNQTKINCSLKTTQRTRVKQRKGDHSTWEHVQAENIFQIGTSDTSGPQAHKDEPQPQHEYVLPSDRLEAAHNINSVSDCCEFCTTYTSQQRSGGD